MVAKPTISVLMAVYNGERYLRQAVDSVLAQTWEDFEFIIVNDGSTDSTPEILESYNDKRILVTHTPNQGLTRALSLGVKLARGEFLARMDADDISLPDRLNLQKEFMDRHPGAVVVHGLVDRIDGFGRTIMRKAGNAHPDLVTRWYLVWQNHLYHSTAMIRKDIMDRYGINYRIQLRRTQDYDLWCKLSHLGGIVAVPRVILCHRIHPQSISHRMMRGHVNDVASCIRENWKRYGIFIPQETASELALISNQTMVHPLTLHYHSLYSSLLDLFDTIRQRFVRKFAVASGLLEPTQARQLIHWAGYMAPTSRTYARKIARKAVGIDPSIRHSPLYVQYLLQFVLGKTLLRRFVSTRRSRSVLEKLHNIMHQFTPS
jgi:glycosyltransferase involved in cell wall biosynthesis